MTNTLIHADNIKALNYLLCDMQMRGKIDLVYIDPPFATGADFVVSEGRASTISSARDGVVLEELDRNGLIEWSNNGNPRKINYADERSGKRVQDVWLDYKDPQYPSYPTEKNQDLVDMIIKTSSNADSIVLDCYCGSGTTLKSATDNGRTWIGIDRSDVAIKATKAKLDIEHTVFYSGYEYIEL